MTAPQVGVAVHVDHLEGGQHLAPAQSSQLRDHLLAQFTILAMH